MPALLAHVDSPLLSNCFSPSRMQRHSNSTESAMTSSMCAAKTRRRKKFNPSNSSNICSEKSFSSSFKSSKEIIYTTKRMKPNMKSSEETKEKDAQSALNASSGSLISSSNENSYSRCDHNHPAAYFDYSSYTVIVDKEIAAPTADNSVNIRNIGYSQYELNQSSMSCSFTQTETNEQLTTDKPDSTTTNRLDTSSLINMVANGDLKPSESYINESISSTTEYSNLFNPTAMSSMDSQNIASDCYVNCYETSNSLHMNENQEVETDFNNNNQITYAISYPCDWQYNLDNLLNCYVAFKNIKTQSVIPNFVQLKCSVCQAEFEHLIDLVKHKEENEFCKNNIQISTDHKSVFEQANKRKSYLINHLENQKEFESEDEYGYGEGIQQSGQGIFLETDMDEEDEKDDEQEEEDEDALFYDEIIDSSDESSLNDDLSLYLNQKNGKLMQKRYKSRM